MKSFHNKKFDTGTQLKLELFRGYIREWIPVFLTRSRATQNNSINFYDFFAGPGYDSQKNPGSPLIILEEMKQYCATNHALKSNVTVNMFFNDKTAHHIDSLRKATRDVQCENGCCKLTFSSQPFQTALLNRLDVIASKESANLIIMDQFGVKEITPEIIQQLAKCNSTDVLFFISSSFIRRFIDTPELGGAFENLTPTDVKDVEYNAIHRTICSYYQKQLHGVEYYLAPFSIRKGSNIYGVIFGSKNLLGLEKFLKVCWAIDPITGEANYNIDGDFAAWSKQPSLFDELNIVKKIDLFQRDLVEFISECTPNNCEVYKFSLKRGFPPKKANEAMKSIQLEKKLSVTTIFTGAPARKGAFYLSYKAFKDDPKVQFVIDNSK